MAIEFFNGGKVWKTPKGYLMIYVNGKNTMLHEFVWEEYHGTKKPLGMIIHHKDENKENFDIKNLELMSSLTHNRIHHGWRRDKDGVFISKPCGKCGRFLLLTEFYVKWQANCPKTTCLHKTQQNPNSLKHKGKQYLVLRYYVHYCLLVYNISIQNYCLIVTNETFETLIMDVTI